MAFLSSNSLPKLTTFFLLLLLCCMAITMAAEAKKATHLHFYMHDTVSGPSPTAIKVVPSSSNPASIIFGDITVIDDPLTEGPNMSSDLVGRAQGTYISASQSEAAFMLTMNLLFVNGKYNGSTLAVLGRDEILAPVRELPVLGGTGAFRKARGYALLKTYTFNVTSGDAVLELDVYVHA